MLSADLPLVNHRILLVVTGSVAACKADRIIRELTDRGAEVQVLLTESGGHFFPPDTAGALTELPVLMDQFESTEPGTMQHIRVKNQTDCILVAPATANRLLNLQQSQASDTLGTILLAFNGPVLYAPAMNPDMWRQEEVQAVLEDYESDVIQPDEGSMACGEVGPGRLADPDQIAETVTRKLWPNPLSGRKWVISGGATREFWDKVRYLTNKSSGRMGEALAKIASRLGAEVTLVTGTEQLHYGYSDFSVRTVETTREMNEAVRDALRKADLYVGAAAVSDYRPEHTDEKIRSSKDSKTLELEPTVDILTELADDFPDTTLVGFSADPLKEPDRAQAKAREKHLDAVIFNSITEQDPFGSGSNTVSVCLPSGEVTRLGKRSKQSTALQIFGCLLDYGVI